MSVPSAIRPVSILQPGSERQRFEGTCICIADKEFRFFVTAEHVVSGPETKRIVVGTEGTLEWPTNYQRLVSADDQESHLDIAIALSSATDGAEALPAFSLRDVWPQRKYSDGDSLVAAGYPASRARFREAQTILHTALMTVLGDVVGERTYASIGRSAETHLVMKYRQDTCIDDHGELAIGAHPRGMSGGAVFATSYYLDDLGETVFVPKLVGILIGFRELEGLLVAVRIECFLDALNIRPRGASVRFRALAV